MSRAAEPRLSFVIATHNRREALLRTLGEVHRCGPEADEFEAIVIDNASTDGTIDAIARQFPWVRLIRHPRNHGPCAKNDGIRIARGEYVMFLDDDSFPEIGSIRRMIRHFEDDPRLGAAIFTVTLPDGSRECSAYPNVCIGCGTGFRRTALVQAGGLPEDFFMAAEEYALSLRMLDAGWRLQSFADLHVSHLKTPTARFPARIARLDARNNTLLALRYFPERWRFTYALAWLERYRLMAARNGHRRSFYAGAAEALLRAPNSSSHPISDEAFEQFARLEHTRRLLCEQSTRLRLRRIVLLDLGKNAITPIVAARQCGLEVVAIADARLGGPRVRYRGIPVVPDLEARRLAFDAVVLANASPVHGPHAIARWKAIDTRPVIDPFSNEDESEAFRQAA